MNYFKSLLYQLRVRVKNSKYALFDIFELILTLISFQVSYLITQNYFLPEIAIVKWQQFVFVILLSATWFVLSKATSIAKIPRTQRNLTLVFQMTRFTFITFLILFALKYALFLTTVPVILIAVYVTIMFLIISAARLIIYRYLKSYRVHGHNLHNVLVVADGFSDTIIEKLRDQKDWGFRIQSVMTNSRMIKAKYGNEIQILNENNDLRVFLDEQVIDEVIYCKQRADDDEISKISNLCNEVGVIFRLQSTISPLDPIHFNLKTMNNSDQVNLVDVPSNNISIFLKNIGDIYFSMLALILLSPVFLLLGLLIRIDSRGPIFFLQERIGLRGRKFKVYKFRTMVVDAEKLLAKLKAENEADGPVFKMKHDPRITRIGRFLRKTGLDELPQLINVFNGEMSLIGPRPPLEHEVKEYKRWQLRRLSVKPGITCTWQVVPDRHNVSFEEWMKLDMGYIDNWNIFKDVKLFVKTIRTFITAGGH